MILESEPKHNNRKNIDDDDDKCGSDTWIIIKYSNDSIA